MYARILIATDGSELSDKGLAQGVALAKRLGSEVAITTVTEPWTSVATDAAIGWSVAYSPAADYDKGMAEWAAGVLKASADKARAEGVEARTIHVPNAHPADGIIALAEGENFDLIVMASHGRRGLGRLLLGSQATAVLTHSKVPVLIVK